MRQQYKIVKLTPCPEVERKLDDLGAGGWRLIGITDGMAVLGRRARDGDQDLPKDDPGRCDIEKTQ